MNVFSKEYINTVPTTMMVDKAMRPWLIKDRKEAVEGRSILFEGKLVHDCQGLDYAKKELAAVMAKLEDKSLYSYNSTLLPIYQIQKVQLEKKVEFWEGKIYILDYLIAATK